MGYFQFRFASRVVIYEHKMFIRLATGVYVKVSYRQAGPTISLFIYMPMGARSKELNAFM